MGLHVCTNVHTEGFSLYGQGARQVGGRGRGLSQDSQMLTHFEVPSANSIFKAADWRRVFRGPNLLSPSPAVILLHNNNKNRDILRRQCLQFLVRKSRSQLSFFRTFWERNKFQEVVLGSNANHHTIYYTLCGFLAPIWDFPGIYCFLIWFPLDLESPMAE
jgi:hypothetical protein